jgi:hypothetical protein
MLHGWHQIAEHQVVQPEALLDRTDLAKTSWPLRCRKTPMRLNNKNTRRLNKVNKFARSCVSLLICDQAQTFCSGWSDRESQRHDPDGDGFGPVGTHPHARRAAGRHQIGTIRRPLWPGVPGRSAVTLTASTSHALPWKRLSWQIERLCDPEAEAVHWPFPPRKVKSHGWWPRITCLARGCWRMGGQGDITAVYWD